MIPALLLMNLRAEGGPALAADLAAEWKRTHDPIVMLLNDEAMDMSDRFEAIGVPVEILGIPSISPRYYPAITVAVRNALRRHHVDALVSIPNGVHGAVFAGAALAGVRRRVVHVGNYPWHWQKGFAKYRTLMRLSAPLTPDLVCVSRHVAEGVATHFGHVARRVHIIENGIDLTAFPFRGNPVPVNGRIEIVMVGRLDSGKDHETLIDAMAILKTRGVPARLKLVGDGALLGALKAQVARKQLDNEILFLGSRPNVRNFLAEAHVFAFSVASEEGLGIALVEAMAVGTPIVATDVGACREVLEQGRCGMLVPQKDPEGLAGALEIAGRRPDAAKVREAHQRAKTTYNRVAMAAAYGQLCGF